MTFARTPVPSGCSTANTHGTKYFAPVNKRNSIWRLLGWVDRQVVNLLKRKADLLNDVGTAIADGMTMAYQYYFAVTQAGISGSPSVWEATYPPWSSPDPLPHLRSLDSAGTYETRTDPQSFALMASHQRSRVYSVRRQQVQLGALRRQPTPLPLRQRREHTGLRHPASLRDRDPPQSRRVRRF